LLRAGCNEYGLDGRIHIVKISKIISVVVAVVLAVFVLYDVQLDLDFDAAGERRVPDPEIEAAYRACYQSLDDEIHGIAFGTIDNPDVQKEYISSNQAIAARECRARFPQKMLIERTPFSFNLVDLEPRFW
jgi:hypothetical protein